MPRLLLPLAVLLAAGVAGAQESAAGMPADAAVSASLPDIELTADVTARSVHFASRPQVSVTFPGSPWRRNVSRTVRANLPDAVLPGRTYRDVRTQLVISTAFEDIDRIVAEVLRQPPAGAAPDPDSTPPAADPVP